MEAQEAIDELERYHGQKFAPEQMTDYLWFFDGHASDGMEILTQWKRANSPARHFPSIAQLVLIADEIVLQRWQKSKRLAPTISELKEKVKSVHGKEALAGITKYLEGRMSATEYLAWMREMHLKWPFDPEGKPMGWDVEANKLERFLAKKKKQYAKSFHVRWRMATEGGRANMLYPWEIEALNEEERTKIKRI